MPRRPHPQMPRFKIALAAALLLLVGPACIPDFGDTFGDSDASSQWDGWVWNSDAAVGPADGGSWDDELSSEVEMMGASPNDDYHQTGYVFFSILPKAPADGGPMPTTLSEMDVTFEVQNDDGSYSSCLFVDEATRRGREISSAAIVIDDSGSMERSYASYQCATCPHDPSRQRAAASAELSSTVLGISPDSNLAIYDFGPDPDAGRIATRVLQPLTNDYDSLIRGLERVDGTQPVGTPLWDALGEVVVEHGEATDELEVRLEGDGKTIAGSGSVGRIVLVISDGQDSTSERHNLDSVVALAEEHDVTVHAVGLGPASALDENSGYQDSESVSAIRSLQDVARRSGGFYGAVESPASMRALFHNIALSMSDGYFVGVYDCRPRTSASDANPRSTSPGERLRGLMHVEGETVPWSVVAP